MAEFLEQNGFHARALKGGFEAWKASGCPVERKDQATRRAA